MMQAHTKTNSLVSSVLHKLNIWADQAFSQPFLYAVLCLIFLKTRLFIDPNGLLASILKPPYFSIAETVIYILFSLVFICYLVRWIAKKINRVNPTFLCIASLFMYLALITFVFDGASGYHIDWHAGFALMMMIDMGLQRERKSLISGLTASFEIWVYLNLLAIFLFPASFSGNPKLKEWLLGNRVFYYRILFPAFAMGLVRYHVLGKKYTWRTIFLTIACLLTVVFQRGGTSLIGIVLFIVLLLWCNRRSLPRYITPLAFSLLALLIFIGIHYFELHKLFAEFITAGLGKTITLSSRTIIWKKTMKIVFNNPLTGIGYLPVAYMHELLGRSFSHTHNHFLELLLHGGFIAVFLYLTAVYFASKASVHYRRSPAAKTIALLLCVFSVMGVVEIFHNDPIYYALFVFLSRADCLTKGVKLLPRISVFKRILRDLKKKAHKTQTNN